MKRLLTIVGTGNMANAVLAGVAGNYDVEVVGRDGAKLEQLQKQYGKAITTRVLNETIDVRERVLILCVKPYALESVAAFFEGKAYALLSVLAGTTLATLRSAIEANYVVRTMPNLAAQYGKSMTTLCGDEGFKEEALQICRSFGDALWLASEKEIDIATAIAGSGPAYLALVAEALADGGVREGLKREDARILVRGLFEGMGALLGARTPAELKDAVMSPGGTTAAGYAALERNGVRNGCIEAVGAAYTKAMEMGKKKE